jgi:hypothetical protein
MAGGFHGHQDPAWAPGMLEPFQEESVSFRVVIERLRSGHERTIPIENAGHVFVLGHIDATEAGEGF